VISTIILPRYFTCVCSFAAPCVLVVEVQSPMEDFDEPSGEPHYEEIGDNAIYAVAAVTGYKKIDYGSKNSKPPEKQGETKLSDSVWKRYKDAICFVMQTLPYLGPEAAHNAIPLWLKKSIEHAKMGRHVYNTSVLVHKSSQQPYIAVRVQVIMHSPNGNTSKLLRRKRAIKPITVEEQNANYFNVMMCPGLVIGFQRITGYLCHLNEQYSLGRKLLNSAFRKSVDRKLLSNNDFMGILKIRNINKSGKWHIMVKDVVSTRKDPLSKATFMVQHDNTEGYSRASIVLRFPEHLNSSARFHALKFLLRLMDIEQDLNKFVEKTVQGQSDPIFTVHIHPNENAIPAKSIPLNDVYGRALEVSCKDSFLEGQTRGVVWDRARKSAEEQVTEANPDNRFNNLVPESPHPKPFTTIFRASSYEDLFGRTEAETPFSEIASTTALYCIR
ncbi:hypothetical protein CLF_102990, partial [Clonorchis sinensis]